MMLFAMPLSVLEAVVIFVVIVALLIFGLIIIFLILLLVCVLIVIVLILVVVLVVIVIHSASLPSTLFILTNTLNFYSKITVLLEFFRKKCYNNK